MAMDSPLRVIYHTHNLSSTCGPGCRCVRQWVVFDSVEADFRRMREETLGYEADELVKGKNTIFVATVVTDGQLVAGFRREGGYVYTESVVLRGAAGTLRRITSEHLTSKWL